MNVPPWVKQFPYNDHPQSDCKAIMMVEQLHPRTNYRVACDAILAMHKAVGYMAPGGKIDGTVSTTGIKPIGNGVVPSLD
jgi:hypothetical protein